MNYKSFSSIAEAQNYLKATVSALLNGPIAQAAVNKEASLANTVVYSYPVRAYKRRYSFANAGNYAIESGDMQVTITSTAVPNPYTIQKIYERNGLEATTNKSLPYVVEYGVGYDFKDVGPRPLVATTARELVSSGELMKILREGLNAAGVAVGR